MATTVGDRQALLRGARRPTTSTPPSACWAPGRDRPARRRSRSWSRRTGSASTSRRCSPRSRTSRSSRGADHRPQPHRGALAGHGHVRRAREFQGFAPNRRPDRDRGLRRASPSQDELIVHNDAYHRQRRRSPASSGCCRRRLAGRGAADQAGQRAHPALRGVHGVAPERIADGVWLVRGGFPLKSDERLPDRGRRRGDRVRRRDRGDGPGALAACARRLGGDQAGRPRPRRRRPPRRRAGPGRAGLLPPGRARRGRVQAQPFRDYWDLRKLAPTRGRLSSGCCRSGTAARSRSTAPSRRATRSPASRSSSSPATRPA